MTTAADLLAEQLEEAQDRIQQLEVQLQRLRRHLPWTEHYDLPDDAPDLPVPRLELEWRAGSPYLPDYSWSCRYSLVYRHYAAGRWDGLDVLCVPMGYTGIGSPMGKPPIDVAELDMPRRDGAHAVSDAVQLGLPLFVRCGSRFRQIDLAEECTSRPGMSALIPHSED